jgi:hypothetical protein
MTSSPFDDFAQSVRNTIKMLEDMAPPPDSPHGRMLARLTDAITEYDKAASKLLDGVVNLKPKLGRPKKV